MISPGPVGARSVSPAVAVNLVDTNLYYIGRHMDRERYTSRGIRANGPDGKQISDGHPSNYGRCVLETKTFFKRNDLAPDPTITGDKIIILININIGFMIIQHYLLCSISCIIEVIVIATRQCEEKIVIVQTLKKWPSPLYDDRLLFCECETSSNPFGY